jgi:hypothetical protein
MITTINCPECKGIAKPVDDWFEGFAKSDMGLYYFSCKGCKTRLGSTLNPDGTFAIWCKSKEAK